MSNELATQPPELPAIMPAATVAQVRTLSLTARAAAQEIKNADDEQTRAFVIAHSIEAIRGALTNEIMQDVMRLQNSPLGFKTDKQGGGYPVETVRDCVTQALIRGLRITGNEFNIIAGNLYVTKEGCKRAVREFPGLTDLKYQPGVPKTQGDVGALVDCKASWKLDGVPDEMRCEGPYAIPVRINKGMGADAILGKAESKMFRRIYDRLTSSELSLPDPDENTEVEE